jgi:hypothetical protein
MGPKLWQHMCHIQGPLKVLYLRKQSFGLPPDPRRSTTGLGRNCIIAAPWLLPPNSSSTGLSRPSSYYVRLFMNYQKRPYKCLVILCQAIHELPEKTLQLPGHIMPGYSWITRKDPTSTWSYYARLFMNYQKRPYKCLVILCQAIHELPEKTLQVPGHTIPGYSWITRKDPTSAWSYYTRLFMNYQKRPYKCLVILCKAMHESPETTAQMPGHIIPGYSWP